MQSYNMKIENAKYHKDLISGKNGSINCIINGQHCSVPMNEENTHYQDILKWVAEGNTIEEAD
tara:strand:+ start:332 stop:520 length:189 start_codon:yes stop_codon:yes gene_type:complete